jgi:NhaC family Na+:H+ antiporter
MVIALLAFAVLGIRATGEADAAEVSALMDALRGGFVLSPWLLLAPLSVILLIVLRMPALPAILVGAAVGAILGVSVQGAGAEAVYSAMQQGYVSPVAEFGDLLNRGGLVPMFDTIGIILCAMAFGGMMERTGMLAAIAGAIMRSATTSGRLVGSTLATCLGMNIVAPDQYLSIVVPGRMYKEAYERAGLAPKNLSRCLEDAGTLTSPLVPWNTCGATMAKYLAVDPLAYLPYAFFNLLCPLVSLALGITGWTMVRATGADEVARD